MAERLTVDQEVVGSSPIRHPTDDEAGIASRLLCLMMAAMSKIVITTIHDTPVLLMDSISYIDEGDRGAFVVSGSHGGISSARYALGVPLAGVVFNDAGIGKDEAGIAGLALLDTTGTPALAVAHTSARIGDAADAWESGVISAANRCAAARGVTVGMSVQAAANHLLERPA